ncbi:MAG: PKD domain-containing protein [Candidatus Omnitrophica bacterium]|nr:PKD domain-containing protein [Candidatus Omnitrophota bacterium]
MLRKRGPQLKTRYRGWMRFVSSLMAGVFLVFNIGTAYGFTSDKTVTLLASAFVDTDTDGDGLGDTWEIQYFGSITAYDGDDDPDGDGYNNLWEYRYGTDPTDPGDPNYYIPAKNRALQFLKAMMDRYVGSGKRILCSYVDSGGSTFGYGWTYDSAISALAFENAGEWQRAGEVLDAFIWFQDKDPIKDPGTGLSDGRIRRAYWANKPIDDTHTGDCTDWIIPPGVNPEASNQAIGDMAFMILAALRYHEYLGQEDSIYLNFAKKLGDWIYNNAKSSSGAGGYHMARQYNEMIDPDNFDRKSTENNIDVYAAFMKLYEAQNDHDYRIYALHAKNFVLAMWNDIDKMFWTGTLDDGVTINGGDNSDVRGYVAGIDTSGQPEDPSTWGYLALGETGKYGAGITWVENNCRVNNIDGYAFGYDFNADRDGIWFEGMSHMALSYQMLGNNGMSDDISDVTLQSQNFTTGGIPCASLNKDGEIGVTTSFYQWTLNTDYHVAPAAWFIFAINKHNPFWNQAITDPIPYEGGYNDTGDKYIFNDPWAEASVTDIAPATDNTARAMVDFAGEGGDDKGTISVADDGIIVKYEWDFDGKGTYDWSSTITGNVTYWYTELGTHLAALRVTNNKGYVSTRGVSVSITQADLGAAFTPPETSGVSASVISGQAPLTVSFTGSASDPGGYVAGYQWDFNGDGEYDTYSESSGNITYTYSEAGKYQPTFKVTDNDGLTDTATLAIEVLTNPNGPSARATSNTDGVEPHSVNFSAAGTTGNITTYEWDFESDGVYDWSSNTQEAATHVYTEPGTYRARLRVTDTNGVSDADTVNTRVEYNSLLADPQAVGSADPVNEIIPFDATFTHSLSIGLITKYEWDFEGDKRYDISTASAGDVVYTYTRPGYYLAALRVTDDNGLTHRTYVPIAAMGPDQAGAVYSSYIRTPKSGQRIYGNSVTVSIGLAPNSKSQDAQLEYKSTTAGAAGWTDIDASVVYPYRTTMNAVAAGAGDYDLRAPVNNISDESKIALVIIDPVNWDIYEEVNAGGGRTKQVRVNKDENTEVELVDGTRCEIPAGTLDADDVLTITTPNGSGTLVDDGENTVLYQREFTLASGAGLNKPITVVIPYDDVDNDGIVDGLNIPEENLELFVYNETTKEWEALANYKVFTDENYVSGQVSHLSIFGLGGGGGVGPAAIGTGIAAAFGGGGGRGCFIATATYGTPMAGEIQSLRFFRDSCLLTNVPGEFIIDMYERHSPPIAGIIERSKLLRSMVRHYLKPIIRFARFVNCLKAVMSHD